MVTGRGLDPWGCVPGLRPVHGGRARPARRRGGPCGVRRAARGPGVPLAAALGGGPPERLRRVASCRAATGPAACGRTSRAPRCSRWRSTPSGRPAGGGDLPRRPGGGASSRPGDRDGRCCTAGARRRSPGRSSAGPGGSPVYTRFWDANYYRTYMEEPGQPWRLHVRAAGGDAGAGRAASDFVDVRREHARLPAQDERAGP